MVDLLVVWGVAQAAGFVFKPILEDLAKDAAKDYTKDFFKDCLKKVIRLPEKDVQKEAYGKALKEFLQLVQDELEDAEYQDAQIKQYIQPLQKFIKQEAVAAALGQAFEADCRGLDIILLNQTWRSLELPHLPETFDWARVSKRYCRRVKAIVQESDKLRSIFEVQSQEIVAEGVQELVGIAPAFDLGRYAEGLREQYGNLKLESLDTTGVYYSELKLWKIFIPQTVRECQEFLPQFYEIPKDQMRRLRQTGQVDEVELAEAELEQHRRVYGEQLPRSILEVVGDPGVAIETNRCSPLRYDGSTQYDGSSQYNDSPVKYVVVLGDPGSGKSTLLQYMALVWAERPLIELSLYPIPLLIELRSYARDQQAGRCRDILTFLHSGNITCRLNQQQLHDKLSAGQAIALFDGIDEVFDPELRDRVVTDIHRFTNDYPAVQVIVTSRWLGYKAQRLRDAGFRHFMLQDLEAEQIEVFMQRWHDLTFLEGADKQRKQERLQKAIRDSKAIRELAGNPLLLTMMAILNRNQELPRDRPELYNQASRVLLHQWDVERALVEDARLDPKTIDYRDKQAMLRKVAYHMQSSEKGLAGNIISATDLENILAEYLRAIEVENSRTVARLMINQLRTRNFILCYLGADSYAFVHRTFLEYFCAWEFVWQFKETQTLTVEQLKQTVFGQHWQDETWHEVLRLIVGMIDINFANELINYLLEQDRTNAGLFNFSNLLLASDCFSEIRNQSSIKDTSEKLLSRLKELFREDNFRKNNLFGNTRLSNGDKRDLKQRILGQAAIAIVRNWKDDTDILKILEASLKSDGYSALILLAEISEEKPEALAILRKFIKPSGYGIGGRSHFSQLRTKISDIEVLKATLQDLNIPFKVDHDVRGGQGSQRVDIVAVLVGDCDLGFLLHPDTTYHLIADLRGIARAYNQTNLINCIYSVYGVKKARKERKII